MHYTKTHREIEIVRVEGEGQREYIGTHALNGVSLSNPSPKSSRIPEEEEVERAHMNLESLKQDNSLLGCVPHPQHICYSC